MNRAERHIILGDKNIDHICFLSKNLYNYCNYILRQLHIGCLENIPEYHDLIENFVINEKTYYKIDEYESTGDKVVVQKLEVFLQVY